MTSSAECCDSADWALAPSAVLARRVTVYLPGDGARRTLYVLPSRVAWSRSIACHVPTGVAAC